MWAEQGIDFLDEQSFSRIFFHEQNWAKFSTFLSNAQAKQKLKKKNNKKQQQKKKTGRIGQSLATVGRAMSDSTCAPSQLVHSL